MAGNVAGISVGIGVPFTAGTPRGHVSEKPQAFINKMPSHADTPIRNTINAP
jgi:hypothetical protein